MRRGSEAIDWRWDPLVTLLVTVVAVAGAVAAPTEEAMLDVPALKWAGLVLLVAACLSLTFRRRYPTAVALLGAVCAGTYFLVVNDNISASIPAAIGLYTLTSQGYRARAIGLIVVCTTIALTLAVVLAGDPVPSFQRTAGRTGWMAAIMIAGEVVRYNGQVLRQARARAQDAEHARDEAARRRGAEERLRIARELHDSLTHSISVVTVQSSVALHLLPDRPEEATEAVRHVRSAGKDAMRQLRSTLRTLRISDAEAEPTPADLTDLLDRVSESGIPVRLTDESGDGLPSDMDATVYRIVQESLTNAVRHSGAQKVAVDLRRESGDLVVTVSDDGGGAADLSEGLGIRGMRERVAAWGGSLQVGSGPTGGFQVRAVLPVRSSDDGGEA